MTANSQPRPHIAPHAYMSPTVRNTPGLIVAFFAPASAHVPAMIHTAPHTGMSSPFSDASQIGPCVGRGIRYASPRVSAYTAAATMKTRLSRAESWFALSTSLIIRPVPMRPANLRVTILRRRVWRGRCYRPIRLGRRSGMRRERRRAVDTVQG